MIARLSGKLAEVGPDSVVIDCGGVGYLVQCSARTLSLLPTIGGAVEMLIATLVREDEIRLIGFADRAERDWYKLLVTVQGVGPRIALSILSAVAADELLAAVASGDKATIGRADGVGPKLAQRIASELKDKAGAMFLHGLAKPAKPGAPAPVDAVNKAASDAISALVNLGYRQAEAFGAVAQAAQVLGAKATVDSLIKAGLRELAR